MSQITFSSWVADMGMSYHSLPTLDALFIERIEDAILVIAACVQGKLPRMQRKLLETEKRICIKSGSVFVWAEKEVKVKRWTDGRSWSASRNQRGAFFLYREMSKKGDGRSRTAGAADMRRPPKNESPERAELRACVKSLAGTLLNKGEFEELFKSRRSGAAKPRDGFKRGGLIKKTFSLDMPDEKWHLVAYYTLEDALMGCLRTPRQFSFFEGISIPEDIRNATFCRPDSTSPPASPILEPSLSPYDTVRLGDMMDITNICGTKRIDRNAACDQVEVFPLSTPYPESNPPGVLLDPFV